ncbi:hypothetical protein C8R42DRAFT_388719 [Lentinula raphanica]|nr:hypothetical protein C8R42DRAFT_388719 [Lentinula raphanica]
MATTTKKTPKDRFRGIVNKVVAMNRTSKVLASVGPGAEPGVNPHRYSAELRYRGTRQACEIQIVDYSSVSMHSRRLSNVQMIDMLSGDLQTSERPSWAKVRWIDVGGISWDVLKVLAIKYKIHPLALEDILHAHTTKPSASKSDYHVQHLFLRVVCLEEGEENGVTSQLYSENHSMSDEEDSELLGSLSGTTQGRDGSVAAQVEALKQRNRVEVNVFPIFILLFRDGTVITVHRTPNTKLMEPIRERLGRISTLLRSTSDASLLVQSILDLAVDKTLGLTEAYQAKLQKFERKLLLKPDMMNAVSDLHILIGDISVHQRALGPLKKLIYGLRRYDQDRCVALLNLPPGEEITDVKNVKGYMSSTSLTYLADVYDHIEYIIANLDLVEKLGENLIAYSFNSTSHEMNTIMKRLTLITVICLPLTFLTGYGGMNFKGPPMWWTMHPTHSDVWFWIVAFPVMAIAIPFFLMSDLKRLYYMEKQRRVSQRALRLYQQGEGSGQRLRIKHKGFGQMKEGQW